MAAENTKLPSELGVKRKILPRRKTRSRRPAPYDRKYLSFLFYFFHVFPQLTPFDNPKYPPAGFPIERELLYHTISSSATPRANAVDREERLFHPSNVRDFGRRYNSIHFGRWAAARHNSPPRSAPKTRTQVGVGLGTRAPLRCQPPELKNTNRRFPQLVVAISTIQMEGSKKKKKTEIQNTGTTSTSFPPPPPPRYCLQHGTKTNKERPSTKPANP